MCVYQEHNNLPKDDPDYSATPYDDVWRTIEQTLRRPVILLMNRIFGTSFTGDEEIERESTEMMLFQLDGSRVRRGVDSHFTIIANDGGRHVFHVECQTNHDGSILLRFAEYDTQLAIESRTSDKTGNIDLYFPHSALINLRGPGQSEPLVIRIHVGKKILSHEVHTQNMSDLSLDDLLDPTGLALLPYYIFVRGTDARKLAKDPVTAEKLIVEFEYICSRLDELDEAERINAYEHSALIELMRKVVRNSVPMGDVSEKVAEMATGKVLELQSVKAFARVAKESEERGMKLGEERGKERGEKLGEKNAFFRRVHEGYISEAVAASSLQMDEIEFREAYREAYPETPAT